MSTSSPNAVTQPIARPVTVVSSNQGANSVATFTWESIPVSQTWVGTLSCPQAPYFAAFTVFNFADQIGFFRASNAFGPFYLPAGGQLSVTATGLLPGIQYTMFFVGYVSTEMEVPPLFPNAYADTIISTNQGGLLSVDIQCTTNTVILPLPAMGFAYRIHSVNFLASGAAATAAGVAYVFVPANNSNVNTYTQYLVVHAFLSGAQVEQTILLNGQLAAGQIEGTVSGGFASGIFMQLNYDLIEI